MQITCAISQTVHPMGADGKRKPLALRPGKHNYPMLVPKNDPFLADELRVLRKHRKIVFDDLLPSDLEILQKCPSGEDRVAFLAAKVIVKTNPKGRKVMRKGKVNADSFGPKNQPAQASGKDAGDGKKPRKISGKS